MKILDMFASSPIARILERLDLQLMDVGARGGMDDDLHAADPVLRWRTRRGGAPANGQFLPGPRSRR